VINIGNENCLKMREIEMIHRRDGEEWLFYLVKKNLLFVDFSNYPIKTIVTKFKNTHFKKENHFSEIYILEPREFGNNKFFQKRM